jgi:hypothetical protein
MGQKLWSFAAKRWDVLVTMVQEEICSVSITSSSFMPEASYNLNFMTSITPAILPSFHLTLLFDIWLQLLNTSLGDWPHCMEVTCKCPGSTASR